MSSMFNRESIAQSYRIFQNHMTKRYNDIHHLRVKRSYINGNLETLSLFEIPNKNYSNIHFLLS